MSVEILAKIEGLCYTVCMMDLSIFSKKRICVAVSGGVDSVSLLHYLQARENEYGYVLSAVHCEHGIRGEESLSDARFVQTLCAKYGLSLRVFSEDCPMRAKRDKQSLETAARAFRYECFETLLKEGAVDFIALAHHKNDDAETVLFRLMRGTSLTGVGGMSEMNGKIIRPFLSWTKAEIEEYARENGLNYCVDSTNKETDATRNKLRLEVLPLMEKAVPNAAENLVRFSRLATEDDEALYGYAKELLSVKNGEMHVAFCDKKPLFRRACLLALKTLGVEKDYTALHLEKAYGLQSLERGAKLSFPQGVEAEKVENGIRFYQKKEENFIPNNPWKTFSCEGFDGGRYEVNVSHSPITEKGEWRVLRVDGDKIPQTAVYRFRREGDFIWRFGGGKKTLKKFFNEEKTPVAEREYLPLIADRESGEVYVVCGVEISEKVKVTSETATTIYISIQKK